MSQVPPAGPAPDAAEQVKVPAILLMVVGGILLAWSLMSLAMNLLGVGLGAAGAAAADDPAAGVANMMSGTLGVAGAIFGLAIGGLIIFGALKMQKLENYGISLAATIVAMVPCHICCIIGLPVGIYSLIVLMKPEIKTAFTS